ncbi:MAG TPA: hypothetical protein ACQGQX_04945 [Xylella taiwanensis]
MIAVFVVAGKAATFYFLLDVLLPEARAVFSRALSVMAGVLLLMGQAACLFDGF